MADEQFQNKEENNEKSLDAIEEEYLTWKKNAPLLYDTFVSHLLEWPSMTCHYFSKYEENKSESTLNQSFAIGTLAEDQSQNYLMIMNSRIPVFSAETSHQSKGFEGQLKTNYKCVKLERKIPHPGEINKLRICPNEQNIIATKSGDGKLYIWDLNNKHSDKPIAILTDNQEQGFALDWNCVNGTKLISGDNQGGLCLYSMDCVSEVKGEHSETQTADTLVKPNPESRLPKTQPMNLLAKYDNSGMAINDCKFQRIHGNIFGAVSDDCSITLWDIRSKSNPFLRVLGHINEIFSIDFSYVDEFLVLTGSADNLIKLWDIRKFLRPIHEFEGHTEKILRVEWNPNNETIFASSGEDKTVKLWDCSRIGNDISNEDNIDGPPELLFSHKGHKGIVEDICWNKHKDFGILSVDSDNILQIWEIDDKIYYDD